MKKLMSWLLVFAMLLSFVPATIFAADAAYYVAGTSSLCGSNWVNPDPNNQMSLNADGLYEKTFENVPAGEHKFKVTDGSWSNCWGNGDDGDGNTVFTTAEVMNVLITFNAETKEIGIELIEVAAYYVAGTEGLCGVGWDPGYAANKMFLDADGLYKKVFKCVPAGNHEFKITAGSWDTNWGADGVPSGSDISFTTEQEHDITITFDPVTCLSTQILSDPTDPADWENDDYVTQDSYTDAVIWELHVRDFSIDETSGMTNKGKFLAFTEEGTTVPCPRASGMSMSMSPRPVPRSSRPSAALWMFPAAPS